MSQPMEVAQLLLLEKLRLKHVTELSKKCAAVLLINGVLIQKQSIGLMEPHIHQGPMPVTFLQ
jgi:hypothetical protein